MGYIYQHAYLSCEARIVDIEGEKAIRLDPTLLALITKYGRVDFTILDDAQTLDEYRPAATFATKLAETLKLFDLSPPNFPFDDRRVKKILERRKQLRGELFFDYLLQQAGINKPSRIFPPLNPKQFEVLIREILSSDWGITEIGGLSQEVNEFSQETAATRNVHRNLQSGIKRACLIYYLLAWWDDEPHLKYSEEMRLASHFTELTHAHFLFDIGVTANAASLLCTPLIVPEASLVRKVFHALSISTDADPSVLILRYARMAKPDLSQEEVLFRYVDALAKVNFTEAWSYQRTLADGKREDILGVIYEAILCPRPLRAALQLLSVLPLQPFEQQFLHQYALSPPPEIPEASVAALHSLIILRLTVEGNYSKAVQLNREFSQHAERLLNSASFEDSRSFGSDARSRPGMLIAQRAEESREMLRESVSLLPLEHRRQLESQLSDGGLSATASFGNPNAAVNINNSGMEMSWEAITAPAGVPMHSTPPRASSPSLIASPSKPGGANARSPIVIPSSPSKGPSSPQKKSPLVPKFQPPMAPIDTQTLGRVFVNKPPTPKRAGLLAYMTPLRTPMTGGRAGGTVNGSAGGVDPDRSGAPPPSTGRAVSKNAFFDPDVRAVKGLILPSGSSPLSAPRRGVKVLRPDDDVEMRDVDGGADTESEEEVQEELEGQSDESFVYAPPASSHLKSNISGGLLSASSIVQMKKTQERGRDRMEKEREVKERERERLAAREREMAAKRVKLEQQRRSLGGNDSSFTSAGSGGGGKRKRDGDDQMTRTDDEMEDADMSSGIGGKAKRKSDGGAVQVVRKMGTTVTAPANPATPFPTTSRKGIPLPGPAQSVASTSSRGALVPPTTVAPSVTSAGGQEDNKELPRRSSRFSVTSGSAPGSVTGGSQAGGSARAPSPTPERSEPVDSDEDEPTSPQMPGAYILDEGDNMTDDTTSVRKTRGAKPRTSAKPASKSKATKPPSKKATPSTSTATGTQPARQTRSRRTQISVPTPIAEDAVLEMVDEDDAMQQSPSKGKARAKRGGSAVPASTNRRNSKAVVEDTTEPDTDDHMDGGKPGTAGRRSSRRLTALTTGETDATTSASSAAGGRKSGRRA